MATGTISRRRREPKRKFGSQSNGMLMTPAEFDSAVPSDFDECWAYELINGVLVVSPIPSEAETSPNEDLGRLLLNYQDDHPEGKSLDATLPEQYVRTAGSRRKADRVIWAGLDRMPRPGETPSIIVEFVSVRKRDRVRDYETKREEYQQLKVQEYWVIDRFQKTLTVHILKDGVYRKKVIHSKQTYRTELLPGFEVPLARLLKRAEQWANRGEEADQ